MHIYVCLSVFVHVLTQVSAVFPLDCSQAEQVGVVLTCQDTHQRTVKSLSQRKHYIMYVSPKPRRLHYQRNIWTHSNIKLEIHYYYCTWLVLESNCAFPRPVMFHVCLKNEEIHLVLLLVLADHFKCWVIIKSGIEMKLIGLLRICVEFHNLMGVHPDIPLVVQMSGLKTIIVLYVHRLQRCIIRCCHQWPTDFFCSNNNDA